MYKSRCPRKGATTISNLLGHPHSTSKAEMKFVYFSASLLLGTAAHALCPYAERALKDPEFLKRHLDKESSTQDEPASEKRQSGPGGLPFTTFNENQLIDVTGVHAWKAPGPKDLRGPCPGLNALANHGYFPHVRLFPPGPYRGALMKVLTSNTTEWRSRSHCRGNCYSAGLR